MNTKNDDIEIMMGNETDKIIEELFESLLQICQEGLEDSMKGSGFVFDSVNLLCWKLLKISVNRDRSYVDSLKWPKNKKETISSKTNDDNCFKCCIKLPKYRKQSGKNIKNQVFS